MAADRIIRALDSFKPTSAHALLEQANEEEAAIWSQIFIGSNFLTSLLLHHPDWFEQLQPSLLKHPRREQGLQREVHAFLSPALDRSDYAGALEQMRLFKQKEMLRIGARDLAHLGSLPEITLELSNLADVCLRGAYDVCRRQLEAKLGIPAYRDGRGKLHRSGFCVLGLGKLGGQELNYSSDVDLLMVYREEGATTRDLTLAGGDKGLSNHKFFQKLAEELIAALRRPTEHGFLFRVDMRLRPEGPTGPVVRSLSSYEHYYAQSGQPWERMMLIKARLIAGERALASDFGEVIQPFRYPRFLSEGVIGEIAATKQRIEDEVVRTGEIERNVKLGRGGIREIEFFVQALQLLHGGRLPFLQSSQTLPAIDSLAKYHLVPAETARTLKEAYAFLREVEHRLQIEQNLQTHTVPRERPALERLGYLMGFESATLFEAELRRRQQNVRRIYDELFAARPGGVGEVALPPFPGHEEWERLLRAHSFKDPVTSQRLIQAFCLGPGYGHVSAKTEELARQLIRRLLALCVSKPSDGGQVERLSDPDRVLARLDSFIQAYRSRALLYETWMNNPGLFRLWLLLFDRSEHLAEIAIRTPDLVDDLMLSGQLRRQKDAAQLLDELRAGAVDSDQSLWLRRYHQVELMRIGLRDILGLVDFERHLLELSSLAQASLQYAMESIFRKPGARNFSCAIIGLGKLGGNEVGYGSDLDVLFVAGSQEKHLPELQTAAAELLRLVSRQTAAGMTFAMDARLRPDGEKGLLVNTLDAYEEYYRRRAQLWEIQALTRARAIAGNVAIGRRFDRLADRLTNFKSPSLPLQAYSVNWKREIAAMRERVEHARTPSGKDHLAIKTGRGGLMDAEFIAQAMSMAGGWREPNTLRALERGKETTALPAKAAEKLIAHYRQLRRVEVILRRWSVQGETLLPEDQAALERVAVRCGSADAAGFMAEIARHREAIRQVYRQYFSEGS